MHVGDDEHGWPRYFRRDGTRCTAIERTLLDMDPDYHRVAKAELPGSVTVSTVWLGLDHQWRPGGPPLIFETMVFGGSDDEMQERYSTEAEALEGHRRWVAKILAERAT